MKLLTAQVIKIMIIMIIIMMKTYANLNWQLPLFQPASLNIKYGRIKSKILDSNNDDVKIKL